ncbi:MAG: SOS response-associated peptidase [Parcubacteria group bacterium]|jgi:putative SOS response-associated peptidase YedK
MCGRFSISTPWKDLEERFALTIPEGIYNPRYNAAPSQKMLVVSQEKPHEAELFQWGLIPHWAKDTKIGQKLINARAETITEKPSFKESFKLRRCFVLADGFYEWDKKSNSHIPYLIMLKEGEPFAFAGIYDYWRDPSDRMIRSFSIITTEANSLVSRIHDRMPVILTRQEERAWLNPELKLDDAKQMLIPYPVEDMQMYQISTLINSPRNDSAAVVVPVG